MRNYGVPYMGSKSRLCDKIMPLLPRAEVFVDLFAGGCAMTHCAMLSGKYQRFLVNDITDAPSLFLDAVSGKYADNTEWISRTDFFARKDRDPYVRYCWSFGNNARQYLYATELEPLKKALHYLLTGATIEDRCKAWRMLIRAFEDVNKEIIRLRQEILEACERYGLAPVLGKSGEVDVKTIDLLRATESKSIREYLCKALAESGLTQSQIDKHFGLQMSGHWFGRSQWLLPTEEQYKKLQKLLPALEVPWSVWSKRLQSLQSLESLQVRKLAVYQKDYREIEIPQNAVIYCDPPYKGTTGYLNEFDHEAFYDWCERQTCPLFISEYAMPEDRFKAVAEFSFNSLLSGSAVNKVIEKIFRPLGQIQEEVCQQELF